MECKGHVNCCNKKIGYALLMLTLLVMASVPITVFVHALLSLDFVNAHWMKYVGGVLINHLTEIKIIDNLNLTLLPLTPPGLHYSLEESMNGLDFIGYAGTGYFKGLHKPEFKELLVTLTEMKMEMLTEKIKGMIYKLIDMLDNENFMLLSQRIDESEVQNLLQLTPTDFIDIIIGLPQGMLSFVLRIVLHPTSLAVLICSVSTLFTIFSIMTTLFLYETLFKYCNACAAICCLIIPLTASILILILYFALAVPKMKEMNIKLASDKVFVILQHQLSSMFNAFAFSDPLHKSSLMSSATCGKLLHSIIDALFTVKNIFESNAWNSILLGGVNSWIESFSLQPLIAPLTEAIPEFDIYDAAKSLGSLLSHYQFIMSLMNSFGAGKNDANWILNLHTMKELIQHMIELVFYA